MRRYCECRQDEVICTYTARYARRENSRLEPVSVTYIQSKPELDCEHGFSCRDIYSIRKIIRSGGRHYTCTSKLRSSTTGHNIEITITINTIEAPSQKKTRSASRLLSRYAGSEK